MIRPARAGAIALLVAACVDPAGPEEPRLAQVRVKPVFAAGETPGELRLTVDSLDIAIVRDETEALVDTLRAYRPDETLSWILDLLADEEALPVQLALVGRQGRLYAGEGTVTARAGVLADAEVHEVVVAYVGPPRAMAVTVTPDAPALDALGATVTLTAEARDRDGAVLPDRSFSWTTSAPDVAVVDSAGVVTAVAEGVAEIAAMTDGLEAAAVLTVAVVAAPDVSTMDADPSDIPADGVSTSAVTVRLADANGHPVGRSGGTVRLVSSLGSLGPVTDHGDGTYTAVLTSGTVAGTAVITGTLDGTPLTDDAAVAFSAGPAQPGSATITADPATVIANGTDAAAVVIRLFDGNGNALGASGGTVALTTTLGSLTPVTDHDDGTYTASLTSTAPGDATVTGTLDGNALADTAAVTFTSGPPDPGTATITAAPDTVPANGGDAAVVTVRLFDADGHPLDASGGTVILATTLGALGTVTDHQDGTYTASLSSPVTGTAVVTGLLDGALIADDARVVFVAGPPDVTTATMTAVPDTVAATGDDFAVVTVRLFDGQGNPLTATGGMVTVATTLGTLTTVTDHDDGTYTAELRGTETGDAVVTGMLDGVALDDDARVVFVAGPPDVTTATITAAPDTVEANGDDASLITVRLFDGQGNPLTGTGGTVTVATTLGTLTPVSDHGDGTYTAELRSAGTGDAVVTGMLDGAALDDDAVVTFVAGPPDVTTATITAVPDTVEANGDDASLITVRLFDGQGNPLTATGGTVVLTTTLGTLSPVSDHEDGTYTAELRGTETGDAVVTGMLDGAALDDDAVVTFVAGPPDVTTATITAVPDTVEANGDDASLITVRLFDGQGNPLTASGGTVVLTTTLGTLSPVSDHEDGTYTASLTSTVAGDALVTGTLDGAALDDDATVTFVAGAPDPAMTTITADPDTVATDGIEGSLIVVRLFDAQGNPVTSGGPTVTLATTLGTLTDVVDFGDGTYQAKLRSTAAGTAVVTGTLTGVTIDDEATVVFVAGGAP